MENNRKININIEPEEFEKEETYNLFEQEYNEIKRQLEIFVNIGIIPRINECLLPIDGIWYVSDIVYYESSIGEMTIAFYIKDKRQ